MSLLLSISLPKPCSTGQRFIFFIAIWKYAVIINNCWKCPSLCSVPFHSETTYGLSSRLFVPSAHSLKPTLSRLSVPWLQGNKCFQQSYQWSWRYHMLMFISQPLSQLSYQQLWPSITLLEITFEIPFSPGSLRISLAIPLSLSCWVLIFLTSKYWTAPRLSHSYLFSTCTSYMFPSGSVGLNDIFSALIFYLSPLDTFQLSRRKNYIYNNCGGHHKLFKCLWTKVRYISEGTKVEG